MLRRIVIGAVMALGLVPGHAEAAPPAPSECTVSPGDPATYHVGELQTYFVLTAGCSTSQKPVRFKVVDGEIPRGMTLFTQGVSSGGITGRPTTEGVYAFTLQVRDETRTQDTESFQITVDPPLPLTISNPTDQLSPGVVGEFYCCGNLFGAGGVPGYDWVLVSGALPPGLALDEDAGRIEGTPTEAGTFTFTVRVIDDRGASAERTFSIRIT
jgi:hypothetical protein